MADELNVLEVIGALVAPFILHPIDNAGAVRAVGPGETVGVVVEAILQLPGFEFAVGEVFVTLMVGGKCVLVQVAGVVGSDDDIKGVFGALGVVLRGGADIISDAVPGARREVAAVAQCFQRGIGDRYGQFGGCTATAVATLV